MLYKMKCCIWSKILGFLNLGDLPWHLPGIPVSPEIVLLGISGTSFFNSDETDYLALYTRSFLPKQLILNRDMDMKLQPTISHMTIKYSFMIQPKGKR